MSICPFFCKIQISNLTFYKRNNAKIILLIIFCFLIIFFLVSNNNFIKQKSGLGKKFLRIFPIDSFGTTLVILIRSGNICIRLKGDIL